MSFDNQNQKAKTILCYMLKLLKGGPSFIVRMIPTYKNNSNYQFDNLLPILNELKINDIDVLAIVCDNHQINVKFFSLFQKIRNEEPWIVFNPINNAQRIFLLFDTVHLIKNVQNSWLNEKTKTLEIHNFNKQQSVVGKWKDLDNVYCKEKNSILKSTNITYTCLNPSPIDRQKVNLALIPFSDKTIASLKLYNFKETALFCEIMGNFWKIVNVKNSFTGLRQNDYYRNPITSVDDEKLKFLKELAISVKNSNNHTKTRCLTKQTTDAFFFTTNSLICLCKHLLQTINFEYVCLGHFESDKIEGEFGVIRQMSRSNYYVAVEQVHSSLGLQQLKILNKLNIYPNIKNIQHKSACCLDDLNDIHLHSIEQVFSNDLRLEKLELVCLYHIAGYVTFKMNLEEGELSKEIQNFSEFTDLLDRGRLRKPTMELFYFIELCYLIYISEKDKRCANLFIKLFEEIYELGVFEFVVDRNEIIKCSRIIINCFSNGHVKKDADLSCKLSETANKKLKISPRNSKLKKISNQ